MVSSSVLNGKTLFSVLYYDKQLFNLPSSIFGVYVFFIFLIEVMINDKCNIIRVKCPKPNKPDRRIDARRRDDCDI